MNAAWQDEACELDAYDHFFDRDERFPAAVTITRTSESDHGTRQLVASIDGITVATLLWGDSITCELEPGPHRIRVHNTLVWKTVTFAARPNEHVRFRVVNRAGLGSMTLVALLGVGPLFVKIERLPTE